MYRTNFLAALAAVVLTGGCSTLSRVDLGDNVSPPSAYAKSGESVDTKYRRQEVAYFGDEAPGTIIIDTDARLLYFVEAGNRAVRYGIGVGREGFSWSGTERVSRKAEWPDWIPPLQMRERQPWLPTRVLGGPDNPLGARALYLGSTLYRIHGSNEPWTIGTAVSSGCIRMLNEDVIDLYERVPLGAKVIVLPANRQEVARL